LLSYGFDFPNKVIYTFNVPQTDQKLLCLDIEMESYDQGWVHKDKSLYTGIFYLNKDPIANSGTSLYLDNECDTKYSDEKKQWIFGNKTSEEISKFRDENNNQFKEIQNLENVYNRLIIFPGTIPHRANKFFGKNKEDSRLTLVFFVFEREKC
jgi:hypothetical protein